MVRRIKNLESIRVASPCRSDWDAMAAAAGDDRARFCRECDKQVYDLSVLTRRQVATLVSETQGKLCARFSFRPDGTLLTREPAPAPHAPRGRASRVAAAAFAAIFGLCASVFAQTAAPPDESPARASLPEIKRADARGVDKDQKKPAKLRGTVYDPLESVITQAKVTLIDESTKQERTVATNDEGIFIIDGLADGSYTLVAEAPGFFLFRKPELKLRAGEELLLDVTLQAGTLGEIIIDDAPPVVQNRARNFVVETLSLPYRGLRKIVKAAPR